MQEVVPVCFMIPYVYDLILGPFLPAGDHMCMFIFVLYNQGTIMVQLPSFPSNDLFRLAVCPGIQNSTLRDIQWLAQKHSLSLWSHNVLCAQLKE